MVKSTRRAMVARRAAMFLPLVGLGGMVALIVTGSLPSPEHPRQPQKHAVLQGKVAAAPHRADKREHRRDKPAPSAAHKSAPSLQPVAQATAPGASADGSLRVAASLLDVTAAGDRLAQAKPTESPGTETAASSHPMPHPEQLAALTPPARAPAPAWKVYAQPFDSADRRPRLALIVAGADDDMNRAMEMLPRAVTLALDPYARRLPDWIELARARGHEVMLTLSAPPIGGGRRDAGPMAILSSLDPKENLERLDWALDRASGFVGVVDIVGHRPASEADPILARLREHGLMLVSGSVVEHGANTAPVVVGEAISSDLSRRQLDQVLAALQDRARRDGRALGIVVATPNLLPHLAAWLASLEKQSIVLAPATAMLPAAADTGVAAK